MSYSPSFCTILLTIYLFIILLLQPDAEPAGPSASEASSDETNFYSNKLIIKTMKMKTRLLKLALCAVVAALPIGAWASVNSISSYKLWTFNNYSVTFPSNTTVGGDNTDLTGDGVIYTGNTGSSWQTVSPIATGLTLNGVALGDISKVIRLQENNDTGWTTAFNANSRNGETYNNTLRRSLAINVTVPGTLYVKVKSTAIDNDRNFELLFNPNSNRTYSPNNYRYLNTVQPIADTDIHELSVFGDGAGTFWFRAGKVSDVYAILFVPAYKLTTNVSSVGAGNVTVETAAISSDYYSSGTEAGTKFYSQNTDVSLNASPNNGYEFVSWSGVDSEEGATATVTMNADKNVTATFEKKVATTVWNFDQYMGNDEIVISGKEKMVKNIDGLYIHINGRSDAERSFKAKVGNTKMAIYNSASSGNASGKSYTASQADADLMGIAYETPSAGTFSVDVYASASGRGVDVYSNGTKIDGSSTSLETGESETISYTASGIETIYIVPTGGTLYFEEFRFVPTTAYEVTKTVNISSAGYATFSATQNYDLPSGLEAYIVSGVNETTATMTKVDEIPACTGVILKGAAGEYTLTSKETTSVDVSSNMLKANIADYTLPADDGTNYNYILVANGASAVFAHTSGTGDLAANKAFLRTTTNVTLSAAPGFTLDFGTGTTGITEIEKSVNAGNEAVFNLNGQRVAQPKKGLYIVNGKKVIIK